jgi:hypothetical protein
MMTQHCIMRMSLAKKNSSILSSTSYFLFVWINYPEVSHLITYYYICVFGNLEYYLEADSMFQWNCEVLRKILWSFVKPTHRVIIYHFLRRDLVNTYNSNYVEERCERSLLHIWFDFVLVKTKTWGITRIISFRHFSACFCINC